MIDYYFRSQRNQHFTRILAERGYQVFYLKTQIVNKIENEVKEILPNLYEVTLNIDTNKIINVYIKC